VASALAKRALAGETPDWDAVLTQLKADFASAKTSTKNQDWFLEYQRKVEAGEIQPIVE